MGKYDDLFENAAADDSVFADKGALDPLAEPDEVVARADQESELAAILSGVHEGYLPTTVSIYGPPGTGKTLTVRRVCREFADRTDDVAVEYVNLKECRTLFSAANEICFEVAGEKKGAYEGLDGVFAGIWDALEAYPEWTVLVLDEIDHIKHDSNYDPSDFFYRLLRGEGKLKRDLSLSVWLISNELLEVDLRLDSRVQSAMGGEEVFFPPYGVDELADITLPRIERAFRQGVFTEDALSFGLSQAATRWGDARKALRLFRRAGETANERGLEGVTQECIATNLDGTDREAIVEKLLSLPVQHYFVLYAATSWTKRRTGEIVQPVRMNQIEESYRSTMDPESQVESRSLRDYITELETMGLVETWIESRGREGRAKHVETTFDPQWVQDVYPEYVATTPSLEATLREDSIEGE